MLLRFSEKYLKATWLTNVENYYIENQTLMINLGNENAAIIAPPNKFVLPRTSTILKGVGVKGGDSLLFIEILNQTDIGGIVLDPQWHLLGELIDFPKDVPLWTSARSDVGTIAFDPYFVTGASSRPHDCNLRKYDVTVNLWFAPEKTNCLIHHTHTTPELLEVHTQIYGTGRMQKFHTDDATSLYQETIMCPGYTHCPFAGIGEDGAFIYPWHQYYADTDCIWAAVEFHPA
jgi:hypothetical protein